MSGFANALYTYMTSKNYTDAIIKQEFNKVGISPIDNGKILSMEELQEEVIRLNENRNKMSILKQESYKKIDKKLEKLQIIKSNDLTGQTQKYNLLNFQRLLLNSVGTNQKLLSEIVYDIANPVRYGINKVYPIGENYDKGIKIQYNKTGYTPNFKYIGSIEDYQINSNGKPVKIPSQYNPNNSISLELDRIITACETINDDYENYSNNSYVETGPPTKSYCKDIDQITYQIDRDFLKKYDDDPEYTPSVDPYDKYIKPDFLVKKDGRKIPIYKIVERNTHSNKGFVPIHSKDFDYILLENIPPVVQRFISNYTNPKKIESITTKEQHIDNDNIDEKMPAVLVDEILPQNNEIIEDNVTNKSDEKMPAVLVNGGKQRKKHNQNRNKYKTRKNKNKNLRTIRKKVQRKSNKHRH